MYFRTFYFWNNVCMLKNHRQRFQLEWYCKSSWNSTSHTWNNIHLYIQTGNWFSSSFHKKGTRTISLANDIRQHIKNRDLRKFYIFFTTHARFFLQQNWNLSHCCIAGICCYISVVTIISKRQRRVLHFLAPHKGILRFGDFGDTYFVWIK